MSRGEVIGVGPPFPKILNFHKGMFYTAYTVDTVDMIYTVDTVYTIQSALPCLNSGIYALNIG